MCGLETFSLMVTTCLLWKNEVLGLFVGSVATHLTLTHSEITSIDNKGDITYIGMWIAADSGGFVLHQCPHVSDIFKSWDMERCRQAIGKS